MKSILDDPKKGLAYFWSLIVAVFIGFILYKWGDKVEILTLIIGFLSGGIMNGVMGLYFGGTPKPHSPVSGEGTTTTADISVTQTTVDDQHP